MVQTYFLGSNTKAGFYSLYPSFPPEENDFLHIIKSGPGTGKSGFMRKIGSAAEKKGFDVHYVLCSGDPDSIDGVYIPQLKTAWVDGTAPHITEPMNFAVNSDYVNLGCFCSMDFSAEEGAKVKQLTKQYKAEYSSAYRCLAAAAELEKAYLPDVFSPESIFSLKKRIDGILQRYMGHTENTVIKSSKRFVSAVSCKGEIRLSEEISKLCKLIYQIDNGYGGAGILLEYAAVQAELRGATVIRCPSAIDPKVLEAVLLPQSSLAFTDSSWEFEGARHIRMDALVSAHAQQYHRQKLREGKRIKKQIMDLAYSKLSSAKSLHDRLEDIYKSHMDFTALTEFTDKTIKDLFGQ